MKVFKSVPFSKGYELEHRPSSRGTAAGAHLGSHAHQILIENSHPGHRLLQVTPSYLFWLSG